MSEFGGEPIDGDFGEPDADDDDPFDSDDDDDIAEEEDGGEAAVQALGLLLSGTAAHVGADAGVAGGGLHALLLQLGALEMRTPGSVLGLQLPPAPAAAAAAAAATAAAGGARDGARDGTRDGAQPPRIVDSLTGVPVDASTPTVRVCGNAYDALALADYFACTRDLRDPLSGAPVPPDDLHALASAVEGISADGAARLRGTAQREGLPASPVTSRAQYFQDMAHALALQLLAICELEAMDSIAAVQATYISVWPMFVRAMCGLANCDVLRAATAAVAIRDMTSTAYAESVREDSPFFLHEPTALQPVASSVFSLCGAAVSGALFGATLPQMLARMAGTPPLRML